MFNFQIVGHFEQGNFAIQDIRLALRIVYENIGNFGGDKNQITIMGNSAGAITVGTLLADEAPTYLRAQGWPFYRAGI
jgi:carboxylesterase type B